MVVDGDSQEDGFSSVHLKINTTTSLHVDNSRDTHGTRSADGLKTNIKTRMKQKQFKVIKGRKTADD